jgi:hypothetical protein
MKLHALLITLIFTHLCMAMNQPAENTQETSLSEIFDYCSKVSLYFFHEPRVALPTKAFIKIKEDSKNALLYKKLSKLKKRKNRNKDKTQPSSLFIKKPQDSSHRPIPFEHITLLKQQFGCLTANELIYKLLNICGHLFHHPQCNNDHKEYGPYLNDQHHTLFIKLKPKVTATYNPCKNILTTGYCSFSEMVNAPQYLLPEKLICDQNCQNRLTLPASLCRSSCSQQK